MDTSKVLCITDTDKLMADYNPMNNVSVPFLTRFEKTTLLGVRLQQLCKGALSVLKDDELTGLTKLDDIAERELKLRKIPLMIVRTLPNNEKELWKIEDLLIM
eukprot:gene19648-26334_t